MIAEIQCLPSPAGTAESPYAYIEAAIAVVAGSGLTYEVGALGTTVEGPPDALWAVLRQAHEATQTSGAASVVSVVKVFQTSPSGGRDPAAGQRRAGQGAAGQGAAGQGAAGQGAAGQGAGDDGPSSDDGPGINDLVAPHR